MRCCNPLRGGMKLSSQHYRHKGRDTAASSGNQHKCHSCAAMALVLGPWYCLCWYGALHAGVPLWHHDDWSSHPLRHFARALLLPCAGAGASALSDATHRNRCAGRARRCAHALGAELPAVVLAHFICRVRVLHSGDGVGLRNDNRWRSRTTSRFLARPLLFPATSSRVMGSCLARGCRRSAPAFPRRAAATGNGDRRDNRAG